MAGPQQYFLVETSEERTLIKSAKRPCEISVPTLLLSWFIAETLLAHLAVDGDNVIISSTSTRQSFTSSGFATRRFANTSTGLFALCLLSLVHSMGHWSRILSFSFSVRRYPKYWTRERFHYAHRLRQSEASLVGRIFWTSCRVSPEDFQTLTLNKSGLP